MKGTVLEKYCFKQEFRDLRIHHLPGVNVSFQFTLSGDHDQSPGSGLRHFLAGLNNGINMKMDGIIQLEFPEEKPFTCGPDDPGIANKEQELPYLGLKYHDKGNKTYTYELSEDLAKQLHLESFNDLPDNINCNNPYKNPNRSGPLHKVVNLIKQYGKQDDVDDVNDPDVKQACYT